MSISRLVDADRAEVFHFSSLESFEEPAAVFEDPVEPFPEEQKERDLNEIEREAFEKGFAAGERSGMEMAERRIEAALKRFSKSLKEVVCLRNEIVAHTETDLVELALEIARKLVHREIQIDAEIIVTLVRVALEKLTVKSEVTVWVSPKDQEVLQNCIGELAADGDDWKVLLKVNQDLKRGDCLVESQYGSADARISAQFQEVEKDLLAKF